MHHQPQQLSQTLLELAEAIEQLALIVAQQINADQVAQLKQLSVVTDKFKHIGKTNATSDVAALIKQKHQKGYIKKWLQQKNIFISHSVDNLKVDERLNQVANFLMQHFNHLKPFYQQLKYSQNLKNNFKFKTNTHAIKYIHKWCNLLHQHKIIDAFKQISETEIYVDIAEVHEAVLFINGNWLEIALRRAIAIWLQEHLQQIDSFDIESQTVILNPDNKNTELDLLLMINNTVFWFECKSGQIGEYYERFNNHRKLLQLNEKNAFLVIPNTDVNIPMHTHKRSGMTTLFATELNTQLNQFLKL